METSALLLRTSAGHLLIETANIIRIEASSNYCKLFLTNGRMLVTAKVLKWFEENLPGHVFMRLHRSHLVNNHFLLRNQPMEKGLVLINGDYIRVSRRRKKNILNQLQAA
jgi:two-component system, LytTR family, response regulator